MRGFRDDKGPGSRALPLLSAPLPLVEKNQLPKVRGDGDCSRKNKTKQKPLSVRIRNLLLTTHPEINPFPQGKVDV